MGIKYAVCRRVLSAAVVAAIASLLFVPGTALAANVSTFRSRTPGSGAKVATAYPTISIEVYDADGVKGSSAFSLSIDGRGIKPTVRYARSGDYRRLTLSARATTPIAVGIHSVKVTVRDRRGRSTSTSWKFTVLPLPAPVVTSMSPAQGSSSDQSRPYVAIGVSDPVGIAGADSCVMTIDGSPTRAAVDFPAAGDRRRFTVRREVPSYLRVGEHTAVVSVRDLLGRTTLLSWTFRVAAPSPMPNTSSTIGCGGCHYSYPVAHPMTACEKCHGDGAPARPAGGLDPGMPMSPYTNGDRSAHTLGCSLEVPCHGGVGAVFQHVLDSDCARCHDGSNPDFPSGHQGSLDASHVATQSLSCVGDHCHVDSLTTEHYRRTMDGQRLSCATCHASTRTAVVSAIASGTTSCAACHEFPGGVHPGSPVVHAAAGSCVAAACHVTDASRIHDGKCQACHANGRIPSLVCSSCHSSGSFHTRAAAAHAGPAVDCIAAGCHVSDVTSIHGGVCARCHALGRTLSVACADCHSAGAFHGDAPEAHTAPTGGCIAAACHVADVTAIHENDCARCHNAIRSPSLTCAVCHASGSFHTTAAGSHAAQPSSCVDEGCHVTDVTAVHKNICARCHTPGRTLSATCSDCHPQGAFHTGAPASHTAPAGGCVASRCHDSDVTVVHDQACSRCHSATRTPSLACSTCHVPESFHATATVSHTASISTGCLGSTCHDAAVDRIHRACARCHDEGRTLSVECSTCHETPHASEIQRHPYGTGSCIASGCHQPSVIEIHRRPGCFACHRPGLTASVTCGDCHLFPLEVLHGGMAEGHAAPSAVSCTVRGCHDGDVKVTHADVSSGCATCHAYGDSDRAIKTCVTCHGDLVHVVDPDKHRGAMPCANPILECHGGTSDVRVIHADPGCFATCHATGRTLTTTCLTCHADVEHTGL